MLGKKKPRERKLAEKVDVELLGTTWSCVVGDMDDKVHDSGLGRGGLVLGHPVAVSAARYVT